MENGTPLAIASQLVSSETIPKTGFDDEDASPPSEGEFPLVLDSITSRDGFRDFRFRIASGYFAGEFVVVPISERSINELGADYGELCDALDADERTPPEELPRCEFEANLYVEGGVQKLSRIRPRRRGNVVPFRAEAPNREFVAPSLVEAVESVVIRKERGPDAIFRLPGVLDDFKNAILATAPLPQPLIAGAAALTFCSVLMGQRFVGPTGFSTNNYILSIAPSGSGKDRPLKALAAALAECGMGACLCDEPASGSALLTFLSMMSNAVMLVDEMGKFIRSLIDHRAGSHQRDIATHWLKLSGDPIPLYTGRIYADPKARKIDPIRYPCLNIAGVTTPASYYPCLTREQIDDGLLNRILTIVAPNDLPAPNPRVGPFVLPASVRNWARDVRRPMVHNESHLETPANPRTVAFADAATSRVFDELEAHGRQVWTDLVHEGSGLESLTRRWVEQALKLAVVAAGATDPLSPRITREIAEWAAAFVRHHGERSIAMIREHVSDSEHDARLKECVAALDRAGAKGLSESQRSGNVRAFKKLQARERREVIEQLIAAGTAVDVNGHLMLAKYLPRAVSHAGAISGGCAAGL